MKRIRFSLRLLILLVTALAFYLGAREWRKQSIAALCTQLDQDPMLNQLTYALPNDWIDAFWQRKPYMAKSIASNDGRETVAGLVFRARTDVYNLIYDPDLIAHLKKLGVVKYDTALRP